MMNATDETAPVLSARNVHKEFETGEQTVTVLRGADLVVPAETSLSIRGESGTGKTTLLNILAGLDRADSGEIRWRDERVDGLANSALAQRRGRYLGMIFQAYYLVPELDVTGNVLLAARIAGQPPAAARRRASELLDAVGLSERKSYVVNRLSGGERQRVAVARALINQPAVVLADEPTGNLDERTGDTVMETIFRACRDAGASLVLVTHNPGFAERTDRQLLLSEGAIGEAP